MAADIDPKLIASFGVAAAFALLMPVAVVFWLRRKLNAPWWVFGLGALAFLVSQLLTRVPLVAVLGNAFKDRLAAPAAQWMWLAGLAITAGLFEETARYLCFRYVLKERRDWKTAVSLGAGHGGFESATLVALSMVGTLVTLVMIQQGTFPESLIPKEHLAEWEKQKAALLGTAWWVPLLGAWERVCAMSTHLALSVLVLQRFLRGRMSWYWLAVGYHAAVDAAAVAAMKLSGGPVAAEVLLTVLLGVNVAIVLRLRDRGGSLDLVNVPVPAGAAEGGGR